MNKRTGHPQPIMRGKRTSESSRVSSKRQGSINSKITDPVGETLKLRLQSYLGFLALSALPLGSLVSHILWRDELQSWGIATASPGLSDLWNNTRLEMHPILWHLLLWCLSQISSAPQAMKALHAVIGLGLLGIIWFRAPFPRWVRGILCLGYFPAFELFVISRSYGLTCLLFFGSIDLLTVSNRSGGRRPVLCAGLSCFLAALAAHTTVQGTILAGAFFIVLLWRLLAERARGDRSLRSPWMWGCILGFVVLGLGGSLYCQVDSIRQSAFISPRASGSFLNAGFFWEAFLGNAGDRMRFVGAWLPFPGALDGFWNTLWLDQAPPKLALLIYLTFLIAIVSSLRGSLPALALWLSGVLALQTFSHLYPNPLSLRHLSGYWALTIGAFWYLKALPAHSMSLAPSKSERFLVGPAVGQAVAGLMALALHARAPFSGSLETAQWLKSQDPAGRGPIIGHQDYTVSPIGGYLGRPIYFAYSEKPEHFVRWNQDRLDSKWLQTLVQKSQLLASQHKLAWLVLNSPLSGIGPSFVSAPPIQGDERFWVYMISGEPAAVSGSR